MAAIEAFLIVLPFLFVGWFIALCVMDEVDGIGDASLRALAFAIVASAVLGLVVWLFKGYVPFIQGMFA